MISKTILNGIEIVFEDFSDFCIFADVCKNYGRNIAEIFKYFWVKITPVTKTQNKWILQFATHFFATSNQIAKVVCK
jgi:hypothetical protein